MFSASDTIVAVATPAGRGGIGVVRVAGPEAVRIAGALTGRGDFTPRHATFATVTDATGAGIIDEVVVTWFQAPRSYTGDDVVEIAAHGSPPVLHAIVERACGLGARLAEPGEFTFRAYLNGRLDLVQAEAVADLVNAVTPAQARVAVDQLEGTLSARIRAIDERLFDLVARLEASLDFPEEGFHFITREEAREALTGVAQDLSALLSDGRRGRLIREGRLVVIAGRPNVGKSSLFNALVGANRAIVTARAGTTRDVLTETVDIGGVPVTLVDTAGVRETIDEIEAEGVRRAQEALEASALSVVVLDGSAPLGDDDRRLLASVPAPRVIAVNKADRPPAWPPVELGDVVIHTSTITGAGLDDLRRALVDQLSGEESLRDHPVISNTRHLQCATEAHGSVQRAGEALTAGAAEEVVLAELAPAREALEHLTGKRTPDDLLAHVFSRFCVGK